MPIYEYRCDKGHTFEVMQRMTEDPLSACQSCGAPARRVFHPVAVHFKGSGFYNTDYGKKKRGAQASEASKDSGSGEKSKTESSSSSGSSSAASSSD
jgi:putative FmdB family regulatory protein